MPLQRLAIYVDGIKGGDAISHKFAYCVLDNKGEGTHPGGNVSPTIKWSGAPADTKSYVIIMVDKDVPADFSIANRHDKVIEEDFPRKNFYHWILIDIPSSISSIREGNLDKIGISGKNDYGDHHMGYDGPCPPME